MSGEQLDPCPFCGGDSWNRRTETNDFVDAFKGVTASLAATLERLAAENDRLREALRFYGDRSSYRSRIGMDSPITHDDFGDRARAALEQGETK